MVRFSVIAIAAATLSSGAGFAAGIELTSREYKLMLDVGRFSGSSPEDKVDQYWNDVLKATIGEALGRKSSGEPRHEKAFKEPEARTVRYRDTVDCILAQHDYSFRERDPAGSGGALGKREVTLKFRSTDLLLAAATSLGGGEGKTKLEEDVAPLLVRGAGAPPVVARPASMRSLFSLSTTVKDLAAGARSETLGDVLRIYPRLADDLAESGAAIDLGRWLVEGPMIRELVFEGAKVDLGERTDAEFTLTLWYVGAMPGAEPEVADPKVAEISYKFDVLKNGVPRDALRRADALFFALQKDSRWFRPDAATKTELATPKECRSGQGIS